MVLSLFFGHPFSAIWLWCVWYGFVFILFGMVELLELAYLSLNLVSHFLQYFFQSQTFSFWDFDKMLNLCRLRCLWNSIFRFSIFILSIILCELILIYLQIHQLFHYLHFIEFIQWVLKTLAIIKRILPLYFLVLSKFLFLSSMS